MKKSPYVAYTFTTLLLCVPRIKVQCVSLTVRGRTHPSVIDLINHPVTDRFKYQQFPVCVDSVCIFCDV